MEVAAIVVSSVAAASRQLNSCQRLQQQIKQNKGSLLSFADDNVGGHKDP